MISGGQNRCLLIIGEAAAQRPRWAEYAAFCQMRERGLRKVALQRLNNFVGQALTWPFQERQEFVDWLSQRLMEHRESDAYGLCPQPLVHRLIIPTLQEWKDSKPQDSAPLRWLGIYASGFAHAVIHAGFAQAPISACDALKQALARDSNDEVARVRLVELLLGAVSFDCHHLPDYYIGDPADSIAVLEEAAALAGAIGTQELLSKLTREIADKKHLIVDWIDFKKSGEPDFAGWCGEHGRKYRWSNTYYYSQK